MLRPEKPTPIFIVMSSYNGYYNLYMSFGQSLAFFDYETACKFIAKETAQHRLRDGEFLFLKASSVADMWRVCPDREKCSLDIIQAKY